MEVIGDGGGSSIGMADILRLVVAWPRDQVRELTRELAATLPTEDRTRVAHELLDPSSGVRPGPRPAGKGDLAQIVGLIPWPEGQPPPTRESIREERVWTKYGSS